MGLELRFTGDMFEQNITPEVLIKVEESILGSLHEFEVTNPCCWKVSIWKRISIWLNHFAMGAMILPKSVYFKKL